MLLESTVSKFKKAKYTVLGPIIGASIALLLSQLGFEFPMAVGYILGLYLGLSLDQRRK